MASQNQISVCNLALLSIGARAQVSSITPSDGSTQADACSTLFTFVFQQLARTAKWGCLNKQLSLSLIQAAQGTPENPSGTSLPLPQQPWLYAYLYPPDCLLMRSVMPPVVTSGSSENQTSLSNNVTPQIPGQYQIPYATGYSTDTSGNALEVVLTNQENAVANYTVDQENPASWDSLFTAAYVASLAAYLVPALSLNPPLMQQQIAIAEKMIGLARGMDGNETPIIQNTPPDWIQSRMGATGWSTGWGYNAYGPINMSWPV
jgi:hypothetical protein